jgi:thiol-disulfide isomerase/thioredoxin
LCLKESGGRIVHKMDRPGGGRATPVYLPTSYTVMRKVIAALLVVALSAAGGFAQDKKDDKKPKLGVGDAAPALKVTEWMNGSEPKTFEKDKVYVLEFWATWCGPCIGAMPHLTELAKANAAKGLVVIGLTNKDDRGNNQKSVAAFVEKNKGEKLGYVVGFSDGEETYNAYMEAAGQDGIPCSFVIGKSGKVEYIGHPTNLDEVLPKVLDGTWKGKADADAMEAREKELEKVFEEKTPEARLAKLEAFIKKYPEKAKGDDVRGMQLSLFLESKKFDDARPIAEAFIAESEKKKKIVPAVYALGFADKQANPDKKHFDVGVKALETALKIEEKNLQLLMAAVEIYTSAGDKDKAAAYGKRAIEAAPNEQTRKEVEKAVDEIKKGK